MIDLTLKKEDKDNFIVNVRLNDDGTYTVTYASGREVTSPFTVHNYQVELFRMERAFNDKEKEYLERVWNNGPFRAFLLATLLIADAFYISFICESGPNVFNIIFLSLMILQQIPRFVEFFIGLTRYIKGKKKVDIIKQYLANKEQFKVPVEDKNGAKEDWYLVDLGNIDQFNSLEELSDYAATLTPEVKEEQGIAFTKRFKGQA